MGTQELGTSGTAIVFFSEPESTQPPALGFVIDLENRAATPPLVLDEPGGLDVSAIVREEDPATLQLSVGVLDILPAEQPGRRIGNEGGQLFDGEVGGGGVSAWRPRPALGRLANVNVALPDWNACLGQGGCPASTESTLCVTPCPEASPRPIEPPRLDDCPENWEPNSKGHCAPRGADLDLDCPEGEFRFYGKTTCERVIAPCPAGDWPDIGDLGGARVVYVQEGGTGDGTSMDSPLGSLSSALTVRADGLAIVLAKGDYDTPEYDFRNAGIQIVGACAEETRLFGRGPNDVRIISSTTSIEFRQIGFFGGQNEIRVRANGSLVLENVILGGGALPLHALRGSHLEARNLLAQNSHDPVVVAGSRVKISRYVADTVAQHGLRCLGGNLELEDSVFVNTQEVNGFMRNIIASEGCNFDAARVRIAGIEGNALGLRGFDFQVEPDTTATIRDFDVRLMGFKDGEFKTAMNSFQTGDVSMERVYIADVGGPTMTATVSIIGSRPNFTIKDLYVDDSFHENTDGAYGRGLTFSGPFVVKIDRARFHHVNGRNIYLIGRTDLEVNDVIIERRRPVPTQPQSAIFITTSVNARFDRVHVTNPGGHGVEIFGSSTFRDKFVDFNDVLVENAPMEAFFLNSNSTLRADGIGVRNFATDGIVIRQVVLRAEGSSVSLNRLFVEQPMTDDDVTRTALRISDTPSFALSNFEIVGDMKVGIRADFAASLGEPATFSSGLISGTDIGIDLASRLGGLTDDEPTQYDLRKLTAGVRIDARVPVAGITE